MSLNLYMAPVIPRRGTDLPDALKFILRGNEEWSSSLGVGVDHIATANDLPYLRGLNDAGVDGASQLIAAVAKHGEVRVYTDD